MQILSIEQKQFNYFCSYILYCCPVVLFSVPSQHFLSVIEGTRENLSQDARHGNRCRPGSSVGYGAKAATRRSRVRIPDGVRMFVIVV